MKEMADELEKGRNLKDILKEYFSNHKRIIFEGDGYSSSWEKEAEKRGLPNRKNAVDAIEVLKNKEITSKLIELGVYSEVEINSRYDILLESYTKTIQVEALTALKMAKNEIFPSCINYLNIVASTLNNVKELNDFLKKEVRELSALISLMQDKIENLENEVNKAKYIKDIKEKAVCFRDNVLTSMNELRKIVDSLETKVDSKIWPIPTYIDLLFGI